MPAEIKMQRSAIKFLPQSQKVSKHQGSSGRRQEEREYLEGIFAYQDEYAQGTAKVWFNSDKECNLAWKLSEKGMGVLVLGDVSETQNSYHDKIIRLYKARIARYDANGKFELTIPGQSEPHIIIREKPEEELVILKVLIHATLIQPSISTSGGSGRKLGLKERHILQKEQKKQQENQTPS